MEYYSLVREGKTAYVSNSAFQAIFGHRGQEIPDFFKVYEVSFPWDFKNKTASCLIMSLPLHRRMNSSLRRDALRGSKTRANPIKSVMMYNNSFALCVFSL